MSATELTLTLSGGSAADARAVVRALEPAFGSARELPADERATIHTATFEHDAAGPSRGGGAGGTAGRLSGAVTVTVQGAPEAVAKARETLDHAFTAQEQGSVSGDQEQEWQLLLEP